MQKAEGIAGTIDHGNFETFAVTFEQRVEGAGGYVADSDLRLNNETWSGTWNVNIPTNETTPFLFSTRNLIDQYGHVTSISTKTHDVTEQTKGNASAVPYTPFKVTLKELSTSQAPKPFYISAFANLGTGLEYISSALIYFIPIYGILLAFTYLTRKVLLPIIHRVAKP